MPGTDGRRHRAAIAALIALGCVAGCGAPETAVAPTDTALLEPVPAEPTGTPSTSAVPASPSAAVSPSAAATRPPAARTTAPVPRTSAVPAPGATLRTKVTFYAAGDNDPPGSATIAFPGPRHRQAGGVGTFDDPVTLASDPDRLKVGTVVYYPPLRKYFVMEDICAACSDWSESGQPHVDLWTGNHSGSAVTACEHALTPAGTVAIELDAPRGRPVDTTPLYGDGGCITG